MHSKIRSKSFEIRLVRAEQLARKKGKAGSDCICFPENEQPFFGFPIEEKLADEVKCPLHGERFMHFFRLYVPGWRRESERKRWAGRSEQFRKAWLASFPNELWPAAEEVVDGKQMLRLKNGTLLPIS
jgi:hypothetical protein